MIAGCTFTGNKHTADKIKNFPAPGTVVAADEVPIAGDTLNNFTFSIQVIADSGVNSGIYDVHAHYGPNIAESKFIMPKGGEYLKPVVRKSRAPNAFTIGFTVQGDTAFYDYFEVSYHQHSIKMEYLKSYTF